MSSPNLGHNQPPDIFDGTDNLPSGLPKMSWFPLDIQALRKVLIDKPLDQRGFYITVLLALYEHMEALPSDERMACMRLGGMDVRVYRRMKDIFVERGILIERPSGRISNARFEDEITRYIVEYRNRQAGRAKRDETIRKQKQTGELFDQPEKTNTNCIGNDRDLARTCPELTPDVRDKSEEHTSLTNGDLFKKDNEINGCASDFSLNKPLSEGGELYKDIESKKEPPKPPKGGDATDQAFEVWWKAFPNSVRKVGKGEARVLFRQIVTGSHSGSRRGIKALSHGKVTPEQLISAVQRYAATAPDPEFVPKPTTWLNGGRWQDDHEPVAQTVAGSAEKPPPPPYWWVGKEEFVRRLPVDAWQRAVDRYANGVWSEPMLGPPPGTDGCLVSDEANRQLRLSERWDERGVKRNGERAT